MRLLLNAAGSAAVIIFAMVTIVSVHDLTNEYNRPDDPLVPESLFQAQVQRLAPPEDYKCPDKTAHIIAYRQIFDNGRAKWGFGTKISAIANVSCHADTSGDFYIVYDAQGRLLWEGSALGPNQIVVLPAPGASMTVVHAPK